MSLIHLIIGEYFQIRSNENEIEIVLGYIKLPHENKTASLSETDILNEVALLLEGPSLKVS